MDTIDAADSPQSLCGGLLLYYEKFLSPAERDDGFLAMLGLDSVNSAEDLDPNTPAWVNRQQFMSFGKPAKMHRQQIFMVDPNADDTVTGYKFSGIEARRQTMIPFVLDMLGRVRATTGCSELNACLGNLYDAATDADGKVIPPGKAYISQHTDDEVGLVRDTPIAAISLGAERLFRVTERIGGKKVLDLRMGDGSLLVMLPGFQRRFKHGVPKEAHVNDVRCSITFRAHKKISARA